jgi:hypothetical protein
MRELSPGRPARGARLDPLDDMNEALAAWRRAYPDEITQAVARAACVNRAIAPLRPLLRFPDLLDQEIALRKSLAEQVQNNKLSLLDRLVQITELHKRMLAEEQSRVSANPAGPAQESPAAALCLNLILPLVQS